MVERSGRGKGRGEAGLTLSMPVNIQLIQGAGRRRLPKSSIKPSPQAISALLFRVIGRVVTKRNDADAYQTVCGPCGQAGRSDGVFAEESSTT